MNIYALGVIAIYPGALSPEVEGVSSSVDGLRQIRLAFEFRYALANFARECYLSARDSWTDVVKSATLTGSCHNQHEGSLGLE